MLLRYIHFWLFGGNLCKYRGFCATAFTPKQPWPFQQMILGQFLVVEEETKSSGKN
jgi:hypothetical protein